MANSREGSDDRIGRKFGNYQIIQFLGRGGFADVYLGQHVFLKTKAAIKVLRTQLTEEDQEDFLKEAQMIANLIHSHIVRVLEFGKEQDTLFLVMDYAPHGSLRKRHKKGAVLSPSEVVPYVTHIAAALQYGHDANLIHRDVKPENMLVGHNDTILLSDFGIAMIVPNTQSVHPEDVIGSLPYMAPEQWAGQPRLASDQYSLAVCVYEWLAGGRPFKGSSSDIVAQLLSTEPLPLRSKNAQISPLVEQVVMKALVKDPKGRYSSVEAFAQAFAQAVAEDERRGPVAIVSTKEPVPRDGRRDRIVNMPTQRQPQIVDMPTRQMQPPFSMPQVPPTRQLPPPSAPLVPPTMPLLPPGTQVLSHDGIFVTHERAPSKLRRTLVGTILGGITTLILGGGITYFAVSHHLIFQPPQGLIYSYPNITASVNAVSWYSGGWLLDSIDRIASAGDDNKVLLWDATTGNNLVTYSEHKAPVLAVQWSPDGSLVASADSDQVVHVWDPTTDRHRQIYTGHSKNPYNSKGEDSFALAWSPDGTLIASGGQDGTIRVWEATTATDRDHGDFPSNITSTDIVSVRAIAWSHDGKSIVAGADGGTIGIWDWNGSQLYARKLENLKYPLKYDISVSSLAWSPSDEKLIAIAAVNNDPKNIVEIVDVTTGERIAIHKDHSDSVSCVSWSSDGQYIASSSYDKMVHIWKPTDGVTIYPYTGHSDAVTSVAWAGDSRRVVSASKDKSVQVWEAFKTELF